MNRILRIIGYAGLAVIVVALVLIAIGWQRELEPRLLGWQLTPERLHIGETAVLTARLQHHWRDDIATDALLLELPDAIEMLGEAELETIGLGLGTRTRRLTIRLQAYSLGPHGDLSIQIPLQGTSAALTLQLPALEMVAREGLTAEEAPEVAPLPDPGLLASYRGAPLWLQLAIIGGGLIGLVLIILVLAYLRRRLLVARPLPPPWERAREALQELQGRQPMVPERFFVELTDIVRSYLGELYAMPAMDMTTPELLRHGRQQATAWRLTPEMLELMHDLLTAADRVKFARGEADAAAMDATLHDAERLVGLTSAALQEARREAAARAAAAEEAPA